MAHTLTPDVALRSPRVVALRATVIGERRKCSCGDKLYSSAEKARGVCSPCAGEPSEHIETPAQSLATGLVLVCVLGLLFVAAGALS